MNTFGHWHLMLKSVFNANEERLSRCCTHVNFVSSLCTVRWLKKNVFYPHCTSGSCHLPLSFPQFPLKEFCFMLDRTKVQRLPIAHIYLFPFCVLPLGEVRGLWSLGLKDTFTSCRAMNKTLRLALAARCGFLPELRGRDCTSCLIHVWHKNLSLLT